MSMSEKKFREISRNLNKDQLKVTRKPKGKKGETSIWKERDESLEDEMVIILRYLGTDAWGWVRNYRFDLPHSEMEIDFALPDLRMGAEINGGQSLGGKSGHGNWYGLERDARKQNRCIVLGWRLWTFTTSLVNVDEVRLMVDWIRQEVPDIDKRRREP